MKIFIDTEFSENGRTGTLELISLALVGEDGRELYEEHNGFHPGLCNEWVTANVLPHLGPFRDRRPLGAIAELVIDFVGDDHEAEFWGYYSDYDWVAFCWLFGSMADLPQGFPMLCMDLQQWWVQLGRPDVKPPGPDGEHHALADARWNRKLFTALVGVTEAA